MSEEKRARGWIEYPRRRLTEVLETVREFEDGIGYKKVAAGEMVFVWKNGRLEVHIRSEKSCLPMTEEAVEDIARIMKQGLGVDILSGLMRTVFSPPAVVKRHIYDFLGVLNALRSEASSLNPQMVFQFVTSRISRQDERYIIAVVTGKYRHISAAAAISDLVSYSPDFRQLEAVSVIGHATLSVHIIREERDTLLAVSVFNGYNGKVSFRVFPSAMYRGEWVALIPFKVRMFHSGYVENRLPAVMRSVTPGVISEAVQWWREARGQPITDSDKVRDWVGKYLGKRTADDILEKATTIGDVVAISAREAKRKYGALSAVVAGEILHGCLSK